MKLIVRYRRIGLLALLALLAGVVSFVACGDSAQVEKKHVTTQAVGSTTCCTDSNNDGIFEDGECDDNACAPWNLYPPNVCVPSSSSTTSQPYLSCDHDSGTCQPCNCSSDSDCDNGDGCQTPTCIPNPDCDTCGSTCQYTPKGLCSSPSDSCHGPGQCVPTDVNEGTGCNYPAIGPNYCPSNCIGASDTFACSASGSCTNKPAGTLCRASAGPCDVPEFCDGSSSDCPADGFQSGTVCRCSSCGDAPDCCDNTEYCSGSSAQCPADVPKPDGTSCGNCMECMNGSCNNAGCDMGEY